MDYRKVIGISGLPDNRGENVTIAIVDSGIPRIPVGQRPPSALYDDVYGFEMDDFGHSTGVSSILLGGNGIKGICEAATPVYIKVLDEKGCGNVRSVVDGIYDAIDADVDLINLSLGFTRTEECPLALEDACAAAFEAGKTIICAAGNDGSRVNWPAALKTTICVGSAAKNDLKTPFSSRGEVDFVAPGVNLKVLGLDGLPKFVSGTSFSTALVTGTAAILVSDMKKKGRRIDMVSVYAALSRLSRDVGAPGWDENTGLGLIGGQEEDITVGMKIPVGFFGKMLSRIKSLLGL